MASCASARLAGVVVIAMIRSENVSDDQVVGEAGEGFARVSRVGCVSIAALALFLTRASFLTGHRVGRVDGFVCASCASLCLEASENVRYDSNHKNRGRDLIIRHGHEARGGPQGSIGDR